MRLCDSIAKAQSVFKTTPAQRNIQTGTFRVWQDLGADTSWFSLWPSAVNSRKPQLLEGFPTLMWKEVFEFPSRKPNMISEVARKSNIQLSDIYSNSPDWADSAALALGATEVLRLASDAWADLPTGAKFEGWIFGLSRPQGRPIHAPKRG